MRRLAAVAAVAAAVRARGCGGSSSGGSGPPRAPTGADEVVVRVVTEGGFTAESRRPAHLPQLSVFGDGRVVVTGPTALQYPGPALPNLQEFRVTDAGLARILEAARAAGLLDDAVARLRRSRRHRPGDDDRDGARRRHHATGGRVRARVQGAGQRRHARAERATRSARAVHRVGRRRRRARRRRRGRERAALRADRARGARRARQTRSDGETHAWPLGDLAGAECAVHTGADLARALDVARDRTRRRRLGVGRRDVHREFRPLLPDERSCEATTRADPDRHRREIQAVLRGTAPRPARALP